MAWDRPATAGKMSLASIGCCDWRHAVALSSTSVAGVLNGRAASTWASHDCESAGARSRHSSNMPKRPSGFE